MKESQLTGMFAGINDYTKQRIATNLKPEFGAAIRVVHKHLIDQCKKQGKPPSATELSPQPELIMEAFRRTPLDKVRVVLLAQDPFINIDEATGLCFSVPRNMKKIPPSTRNMYACLEHSGYGPAPAHGDLSSWADQGVLMLNCALTTVLGTSNAHASAWEAYTDGVIKQICELPQRIIFILLGGFAQKKGKLVTSRHTKLMWGHPSPVNNANKSDNPRHFKYSDVFMKTNQLLVAAGDAPIMWGSVMPVIPPLVVVALDTDDTAIVTFDEPVAPTNYVHSTVFPGVYISGPIAATDAVPPGLNTLYICTDGGAIANGKPDCKASWGFYMTDGKFVARASGQVEPKFLPGCNFQASNNRGELMAILHAFEYLLSKYTTLPPVFTYQNIIVISDSKYSIDGIELRDLNGKMNVDLIAPAKDYVSQLRKKTSVKFIHVAAGHDRECPTGGIERFYWLGNDIVDMLCNEILGLDKNKKRI